MVGQQVLVRTRDAGVHFGEVTSIKGDEVILKDATRIWRWRGAYTLSELSQCGADEAYTRISMAVPEIRLIEAIEVIPCSAAASENLAKSRWDD